MPTPKRILQSIMPPLLWNFGKACKRRLFASVDHRAYTPRGWATPLPGGVDRHAYWAMLIDRERAAYEQFVARVQSGGSLLAEHEEIKHAVFGYVLALTARSKQHVTVLDYGGNLGEYYWLGKALVPGITLEYHCKELQAVAQSGREINQAVTWHADDTCFEHSSNLVMFSSSIQCLPDWQEVLRRAAKSAGSYLLLSDVATVKEVASFVATSRSSGMTTLQIQLNRDEVVNSVEREGLRLMRELPMGAHPPVANAPEQPTCTGWLFQR